MKKTLMLLSVATLFAAGCASTPPAASFKKEIADAARLCETDTATVRLASAPEVVINDASKMRFESTLRNQIEAKKKGVQCSLPEVKRSYILDATITRYDEGSKFGRMMLAGVGAMHIDGEFVLKLAEKIEESVAEFTVNKTFAWGGLYGASTGMDDIEPAFAESVAIAIVAEKSDK